MVGSRVEVAGELRGDLGRAAMGDQRIDQPIAAAPAEVIVGPAQPAQVAGVVDQAEMRVHPGPAERAGPVRVAVSSTTLCSGASSGPGPGDDRTRYQDAKARRNYAGTSPITKASGTKKVVMARFVRNDRLTDAVHL